MKRSENEKPSGWPGKTVFLRIRGGFRWNVMSKFGDMIGTGWEKTKTKAAQKASEFSNETKRKLSGES